MDRGFKGPVLVEEAPDFRECNGIMYFWASGTCSAAMRMEVFEAYIYAGMEEVTSWRNRRDQPPTRRRPVRANNCAGGEVIPFKR